ncbi:hypothetical protein CRE_13972 [Caenorhabditis remanei]|uniref:C-type lectin domain-containing protein n=1 Tax=Caenorhabditis remanei TaxID=31234 RepID=E3M8L0_CAERE|nr:hypothetical protein CRE_13972 [Caenorhabditis remanei]
MVVSWTEQGRTTLCVEVFSGTGTAFYAQEQCKTRGATLTGVQDGNERSQIANAARIVNNANGGGSDVWIDGKRRAECPWKAACAPNDTFEWTDGHTTGTAGFWWPGIEPSGSWNDQWRFQSCLVIHVSAADGQMGNWGYPHGSMDDEHCQQTWRMYACGKKPS